MSRIDQAWRRASGAVDFTERKEEPADAALHRYALGTQTMPLWPDAPARLVYPPVAAPRTGEAGSFALGPDAGDHKQLVGRGAPSLAVEQYRRLAGTLYALQRERGLKALMVTSALPGEGKTLTIVNLALTLSESFEHRVLLIDADVRRPRVHHMFGIPNARGLGDLLSAEHRELPLLPVSERLSVLPSGCPVQPMALTSDRMRALLDQAASTFDWVLLDAAPVGFMPDAEVLARVVGAVLFVIAADASPHALVERAIGTLDPECLVGTVLNAVAPEDIPAAAYYRDDDSERRPGD
jgi:capsular exopolysaccharide synthesis family protein